MGQKGQIPFPQALDNFGKDLLAATEEMKRESLKGALCTDLARMYGAIYWMQQLVTLFYNSNVMNFDGWAERTHKLEMKIGELETKIAGYSSEINTLRGQVKKLEENNTTKT